jgi:hypothetical protein
MLRVSLIIVSPCPACIFACQSPRDILDINDSGPLSKLDISGNQICGLDKYGIAGTYNASGLAALAKSIGNLKELNISNNFLKAEGAEILAPALEANGSLSRLDVSRNHLCGVYIDEDGDEQGTYDATGLTALAKSISNLKELSIPGNWLKAEGAKVLARAIEASRPLSKLTFNGGVTDRRGDWKEGGAVTIDTTMTEADFSGKNLGAAGAQILAAFISTKMFEAKGSLASLDISRNRIGDEQEAKIKQICAGKSIKFTL